MFWSGLNLKVEVMGRYIECKINGKLEYVWKYVLGGQLSEMYRIQEELGVGEYHPVPYCYEFSKNEEDEDDLTDEYVETRQVADGDILILNRKDIEELKIWLELLKQDSEKTKDRWFISMVEAIKNFMLRYTSGRICSRRRFLNCQSCRTFRWSGTTRGYWLELKKRSASAQLYGEFSHSAVSLRKLYLDAPG